MSTITGLTWIVGRVRAPIRDDHQGLGGGLGVPRQGQNSDQVYGSAGISWLHTLKRAHNNINSIRPTNTTQGAMLHTQNSLLSINYTCCMSCDDLQVSSL